MEASMEAWISKKELLQATGISYGQLYRWKRQNLIPEAWFRKQSSFTGQETYFPRDKILQRIAAIQQLKDQYSLEELSRLLSPERTNASYGNEEVERFAWYDAGTASQFERGLGKSRFSYHELLFLYAGCLLVKQGAAREADIDRLAACVRSWIPAMAGTDYRLLIWREGGRNTHLLASGAQTVLLDPAVPVAADFRLEELAKQLNKQFNPFMEE
ncbi:hypothetical protein J31TS4_12420 [Paenibacillus sp. J31TS4]|uniref:DUF4004 family protein n=1 Tax=Paenibacillus sp. J31TS4 TaxID=2807195 RepID=UPI001B07A9FD|nr:DUF4004 family protein [Paenibacillus sp. J31TS4]GIP37962.1 hypothetical protein J31TS4_12420 [Paenibacillus sp. J31TS4]